MTSIGGLGTSLLSTMQTTQRLSPEELVEEELESLVATGEISADDQDAMSSALDAISQEMRSSAPDASTPPPSKDEIQEKIDSLIDAQVEAGVITEDQADELSNLFEEIGEGTQAGGPGGPGGAGGPPPGPPPGGGAEEESETSSTSDESANALLSTFLEQLQEQNATSYGSSGTVSGQGSLLFNYTA